MIIFFERPPMACFLFAVGRQLQLNPSGSLKISQTISQRKPSDPRPRPTLTEQHIDRILYHTCQHGGYRLLAKVALDMDGVAQSADLGAIATAHSANTNSA